MFKKFFSHVATAVFVACLWIFPAAAQARTAVIIGDSQGQGLLGPLTTALGGYDTTVVGSIVQQGFSTNQLMGAGARGLVTSRNPDLIIVIAGGNDIVGTSADDRSNYQSVLSNAIASLGGNANIPKIVWIGPAFSKDAGVQSRHDRIATYQQAYFSGLSVRWIDGRTGSRPGPYQQDVSPGTTEMQIRSRSTHLTGQGYMRWACELAPQIVSGSMLATCPASTPESDIVVNDVPGASEDVGISSLNCGTSAEQTPITLGVSIAGVSQVSGLPEYINIIYRYLASISLVIAIVMVVYGGFLYLVGSAGISSVQRGKQIIKDAIIGMLIILGSYSILNIVNPRTTILSLNPPAIECQEWARREDAESGALANLRHCLKDTDCRDGRVCLRTAALNNVSTGQCTGGNQGELCKCSGTGCDVTDVDGVPTNNGGTKEVRCNTGSCTQAGSGGVFSSEATGNWICNSGTSNSQCNVFTDPPVNCATGFFCEQKDRERAGRCVAGDYRDQTLDPRPVCSSLAYSGAEEYYRETNQGSPFVGGCLNVSGSGPDSDCMAHHYRCSNDASNRNVCGEESFADLFRKTGDAYNTGAPNTWDFSRAHVRLRPWSFARFGCRKPIGASCTTDEECSSMCVNNRCSGFCIARVRNGSLSLSAGSMPPRDEIEGECTASCGDDTWSAMDFGVNFRGEYFTVVIDGLDQVNIPTILKSACYPRRATGSKCDYSSQCESNTCRYETGALYPASPFPSFSAPLDMNAGYGTCTES